MQAEVASVPFLPKRTISAQGISSISCSATSVSRRWGSEKMEPRLSCSSTAWFTSWSQ
ncbi:hypothetical protein D3C87_2161890 [compost metagenome]